MVQRLTYRRRHPYHNRSNRTRIVKTPGGRLVYQYVKKTAKQPHCAVSGVVLNGFPSRRLAELSNNRLSKKNKTVNRAYGGNLSHSVVRERIIRAFLIEEQKIVKKVLKLQSKSKK